MTPKLVIYGDSFAKSSGFAQHLNHELAKPNLCWSGSSILTDNYEIDNFSSHGGDFYSYYDMFINNHEKYDRIVFIVTDHTRIGFEYKNKHFCLSGLHNFEQDRDWAIQHFDNEFDKLKVNELFESARIHIMYTIRDKLYEAGTARLIKEIQEIRPDAVIIPAFENQYLDKEIFNDFFLCQVHNMETYIYNISDNFNQFLDLRPAHMSIENNEILANYVYNRLQGNNMKLSLDMFVKPKPEEKTRYFIPKAEQ